MRILHLCPDLGVPVLGHKGASIHVRELVKAMRRKGHTVVSAAACLTKSPWEEPVHLDGPLVHVPPSAATAAAVRSVEDLRDRVGASSALPGELRRLLYDRDLLVALREHVAHHPPDVIYERAALYSTAGAALSSELGVPRIVELNAPLALEHATNRAAAVDDIPAAAEAALLASADAVVVVSEALREYVVESGVPPDRVTVRPNGVDVERFRPGRRDIAARTALGLNGEPTVGFVGGLREWHGAQVLPALLERLSGCHADLRLVVVGDGPMAAALQRELLDRGLSERVTLTGDVPHDEVPGLIRQLDVALAPYPRADHPFYSSPLKVLEYLACGVPVVAPDVGQFTGLVGHEQAGLLYEAGDLDALTVACERLLADAALRKRLGATGAESIRTQHGWDTVAGETIAQAEALVQAGR